MRLSSTILILLSFALSFLACKGDNYNKDLKKKRAATEKKKPAAKANKAKTVDFFAAAKKSAGLTDQQINSLKQSRKTFEGKIAALKKAKKWDGKQNATTRKKMTDGRQAEIKKLLGSKYPKYTEFLKLSLIHI